jgi:cytochrome c oxidase subunit I+III
MILTLLVFGVVLACLLFSYFYIRLENPVWPPQGFAQPEWLLPVVGLVLWMVSLIPLQRAIRAIHEDNQPALRNSFLLSVVPAAVGTGLILYTLFTKEYSVSDHAYASLFILTEGYLAMLLLGGVGMNLFVYFLARRGIFSSDRFIAIENTSLYFTASAVFGLITIAVLYGVPYLS